MIKSSFERDQLRKKYGFIGLETEAHGVVDVIPVGQIRGVCHYADKYDTHEWYGYAAMAAASYAREVLYRIHPRIDNEGSSCVRILLCQLKFLHSQISNSNGVFYHDNLFSRQW